MEERKNNSLKYKKPSDNRRAFLCPALELFAFTNNADKTDGDE
jgi:hypothetical protein